MNITEQDKQFLIKELTVELKAKPDGAKKNLIVPICPYCGHANGKFGIYIGPETAKKKPFMTHCFSCGHTTININDFLDDIGRSDLKILETTSFAPLDTVFVDLTEDEIDDELVEVSMPEGWRRTYRNQYLKNRGITDDDLEYFVVGTTCGLNWKFDNYVIFPIIDEDVVVGFVGRHIWDKKEIDEYNTRAKRNNSYLIRRYMNSTENDFIKLLYNYDNIIYGETSVVIIVEGVFDVIGLTRKLDLYDNHNVAVVATFGKKISDTQIYKIQSKGVQTVVVGYDGDAYDSTIKTVDKLTKYFDVYIAHIMDSSADFDSMNYMEIFEAFTSNLKSPIEYKLNTVQL